MFVPLVVALAVAPPRVLPPTPALPAVRTQLFTPLDPALARLLGDTSVRTAWVLPLARLRGVVLLPLR